MFRNARRTPTPQKAAPTTTLAPCSKGINAVDPLGAMSPEFGLSIQNWLATPSGLSFRRGFRKWATGLPTSTTTLITYNGRQSSANKLFAVSGSAIYDVSSPGAVGAAEVSGLDDDSPYWQYAQQTATTANTNYLIAVNGSDIPLMYDGSTWTQTSQTASPSAPGQFKNVDSTGAAVNMANFNDVILHQQRLWFVPDSTTKAYYCDIAQAGGNLYPVDFGPHFKRGGFLHKLDQWTVESGNGVSAMLVAISNKGDIAVFQGSNPADANSWALLGTWELGSPIGQRCTVSLYGELCYLSTDGLYPLNRYISTGRAVNTASITYYINPVLTNIIATYGSTPGFEAIVHPGESVMLLNIPQLSQNNNFQFAYQTVNKAWTQFTGWPAQCFGLFNDALYFGGPDYIALGFIGFKDGADIDGSGGDNIQATALTAFSTLGYVGKKHAKQVKPYIVTGESNPTVRVGVNTDFNLIPIVGSATVNPATGAVWDAALWDDESAVWVGTLVTNNNWATPLSYPGNYLAFALSVTAVSETTWTAVDWIISPGGIYG